MATGDRTGVWRRTVVPTAGGGQAELDVLMAKPQVNLVWLQLREARTIAGDAPDSLHGLWDGRIGALGAQLASGTPVKRPYAYTKDQVIRTIAGVLERYRPTTIRMQDPTPGRYERTGKCTDHQDHMYGARFVQAAAAAYAERVTDRPHFSVQNYLGYHNGALPHALDPQTVETKTGYLRTYAWQDHRNYCASPSGCGDRKVAGSPTGRNWAQSLRYTRADSTSWLTEGAPGRLRGPSPPSTAAPRTGPGPRAAPGRARSSCPARASTRARARSASPTAAPGSWPPVPSSGKAPGPMTPTGARSCTPSSPPPTARSAPGSPSAPPRSPTRPAPPRSAPPRRSWTPRAASPCTCATPAAPCAPASSSPTGSSRPGSTSAARTSRATRWP